MVFKASCRIFSTVLCITLCSSALLLGQAPSQNRSCNALALQTADHLTLKQRGCFYTRQLTSPQFALSSVVAAAFDQYRNSPHVRHESWDKFPHRIEIYYARHAARDAGEFLIGYWHKEDPRARPSTIGSFWHRTNSALLSVVTSPDDDGHLRPAYAPVAGAMSSAFVGTMMYRHSETLPNTLTHAGIAYGFYFVRAVFTEFKPDLAALALKIWQ